MPVEIRELIIKATVEPNGQASAGTQSGDSGNSAPNEEIIRICVDKILEILKEKNER